MLDEQEKRKPVVLCILDGWGLSPSWTGNAIAFSNPPIFERLWKEYPHTVLHAYQPHVQSERHRIGSSDISHAMIGSGRALTSDLEEISQAIDHGVFENNPVLMDAMRVALQKQRPIHLVGMVSDGGIHSDIRHLIALLKFAKRMEVPEVFIHVITDGRDVSPGSAGHYLDELAQAIHTIGIGTIASLVGRFHAMDRDRHWDRTLRAYKLWVLGEGQRAENPRAALESAYAAGWNDEYLPPVALCDADSEPLGRIADGDVVIAWNVRTDRLRQLARAFVDASVFRPYGVRQAPMRKLSKFVTLVSPRLSGSLPLDVAFPPAQVRSTLPEILAGRGKRQLRAAESEKMAHITYFFNGGRQAAFPGEDRLIIQSPNWDPKNIANPALGTPELVSKVVPKIRSGEYDFIAINIANVDLVSHSGNLFAAAEAIKIADRAVGQIVDAVLEVDGHLLLTADHGNAEQMLESPTNKPDHHHTVNPVPFIWVSPENKRDLIKQAITPPPTLAAELFRSRASLADIAPTILEIFDIPIPIEMSGQSLLPGLQK